MDLRDTMEWSKVNGDVRAFGYGPPRDVDPAGPYIGGYKEEFAPRTHLEYGPPPKTRIELIPSSRAFAPVGQRAGGRPLAPGVQEFSFSQGGSARETHDPAGLRGYPLGRKGQQQQPFMPEYATEQECRPFPTLPQSDQGCHSANVCSDCPPRGSPCDFGPDRVCFHSGSEAPIRTGLRTGADGRLHGADPSACPPPLSPDEYPVGHEKVIHVEGASDPAPDCGAEPRPFQIAQSPHPIHHASHCDLKDFHEWRDLRGSRESLRTLPPDLERHLRECRCPCDHLGYGNYQVSGSKVR